MSANTATPVNIELVSRDGRGYHPAVYFLTEEVVDGVTTYKRNGTLKHIREGEVLLAITPDDIREIPDRLFNGSKFKANLRGNVFYVTEKIEIIEPN